jgi:hypothetical protein
MLKQIVALTEAESVVSNEMYSNINKTRVALLATLKKWSLKSDLLAATVPPNQAIFTIDVQKWLRPEDISELTDDLKTTIERAKIPGELFKIVDNSFGSEFVEAMLSGLRPGMKSIPVESFFPTFQFEVTWKNVVSRKVRK